MDPIYSQQQFDWACQTSQSTKLSSVSPELHNNVSRKPSRPWHLLCGRYKNQSYVLSFFGEAVLIRQIKKVSKIPIVLNKHSVFNTCVKYKNALRTNQPSGKQREYDGIY